MPAKTTEDYVRELLTHWPDLTYAQVCQECRDARLPVPTDADFARWKAEAHK